MSRTTRKRAESFEARYNHILNNLWLWNWTEEDIIRHRVSYYTSSDKWYSYNLPKYFRNSVNRTRRRKDKREIWKSVNFYDYPEQCLLQLLWLTPRGARPSRLWR